MAPAQAQVPSSHTLWSPYDTVKDVADALGITSQLSDEVAKNTAMDVEYRIHEILEQALKFMRHGKRKTLTVQDVDRAMRVLNLEPLYGYDTSRPLVFKEAMVGPGQNLYYVEDDEVDFEKLVNQPLPKVPRLSSVTAHWLAIEGVQPTIPQNPNPAEIRQLPPTQRGSMQNLFSLNNDDVSLTTSRAGVTTADTHAEVKKDLDVKPLVRHVLSKELQLYFDKAIAALVDDSNESLKNATLESIRSDQGLHQLVPYFTQFVAETITHNLQNVDMLTTMLMVIYSLLTNKSIFLEPYIHALMPCVLTLLLARNIGPTEGSEEEIEQHFKVRELSASLLENIVDQYGSPYNTLKPRVARTLLRVFLSNTTKGSVGTQFGAIKGMKYLGPEVIRIMLTSNLKNWSTLMLSHFEEGDKNMQLLVEKVIECLRVLAKDGSLESASGELTDDEKAKLTDRVGAPVANAVAELDDARNIYNGVFFGELGTE